MCIWRVFHAFFSFPSPLSFVSLSLFGVPGHLRSICFFLSLMPCSRHDFPPAFNWSGFPDWAWAFLSTRYHAVEFKGIPGVPPYLLFNLLFLLCDLLALQDARAVPTSGVCFAVVEVSYSYSVSTPTRNIWILLSLFWFCFMTNVCLRAVMTFWAICAVWCLVLGLGSISV